ncbi:hypothetical protein XACM_1917 [Xanthomonas euvesicatoria pv. citrumelo F1]|nr:hypothetical protein XACM_1917 [Xanthomonas euvesicatoria pv. citrumelo F1]
MVCVQRVQPSKRQGLARGLRSSIRHQRTSGLGTAPSMSLCWLQGPCPPTIAGHAASASLSSVAASMPPRVPRRWAGKDQSRWSMCRVSTPQPATTSRAKRCPNTSAPPPENCLARCPCRLPDRWRHGCRHRAAMDGFMACPAGGEGSAPSML